MGAEVVRTCVTGFAYCATATVTTAGWVGAESAATMSGAATGVVAEVPRLTVLATVTRGWDSAVPTPTWATDAEPMAAIDSATASHPTVSAAT